MYVVAERDFERKVYVFDKKPVYGDIPISEISRVSYESHERTAHHIQFTLIVDDQFVEDIKPLMQKQVEESMDDLIATGYLSQMLEIVQKTARERDHYRGQWFAVSEELKRTKETARKDRIKYQDRIYKLKMGLRKALAWIKRASAERPLRPSKFFLP